MTATNQKSPINAPKTTKKRILFVHNLPQRFVVIDRDLLQQRYDVQEYYQRGRVINLMALLVAVRRCDLVFCWFASWHSLAPVLLAKWLGKPSVVIIGGYDTANVPEAGYGAQRGGFRQIVTRAVIRNARQLIAFSDYSRQEAINHSGADPTHTATVYLGVPPLESMSTADTDTIKRPDLILTVGGVRQENLLRKGLLPFVESARLLPNLSFVLVGAIFEPAALDILKHNAPPNVTFCGEISSEQLAALYRSATVYVQASLHEGFGLSVAEAMLAKCIPVVNAVGSLPEVVGDTGVIAKSALPADIATAIQAALRLDDQAAQAAHDRIVTHFPLERRQVALYAVIERLLTIHVATNGVL